MKDGQFIYLSTGIDNLDDLLSPDREDKGISGGIFIARTTRFGHDDHLDAGLRREQLETPIVVIEGTTGTGKTTLALQIAHATARNAQWIVFYYSLEQTLQSLYNAAQGFGFFKKNSNDPKVEFIDLSESNIEFPLDPKFNRIYFGQFSPRPFTVAEESDIFEQRISELDHLLNTVTSQTSPDTLILLVLDSITALAGRPLQRNEIYRFFTLLRNYHIPSLITLERYSDEPPQSEQITFECTRFLADVVISLTKEHPGGYLQHYLEIIKSRVGRHALGKHLYKIRTQPQISEQDGAVQTGILVYQSIHYMLTKVRGQQREMGAGEPKFQVDFDDQTDQDLALVFNSPMIKSCSFTAIIGPNGSHKLALAVNLALGRFVEREQPRVLIVNFGNTSEFGFNGIAWTKFNQKWRRLGKISEQFIGGQSKFSRLCYGVDPNCLPIVTITAFRIGQLAPEECFDVIEKELEAAKKQNNPFTSVLINNTAELCTSYPLLKNEPLFIPTLLDLCNVYSLVAVGIGVEDISQPDISAANVALFANADYRIKLSHYPNVDEFFDQSFRAVLKHKQPILEEQLVWLIIDNVSGRHYRRQPKRLWVEEIPYKSDPTKISHKILHIEDYRKFVSKNISAGEQRELDF
ncbi:MAG: hypothetical protein ONB32_04610 [candidate division KSB1 bacterium]|nr:hypothetical protein [candidate division KSB1 bacterium]MDZ7398773.1 hypothetical protein [candidate division KSB1 bacterium]